MKGKGEHKHESQYETWASGAKMTTLLRDNSESLGKWNNNNVYINIHGDPSTILKIWKTIKRKNLSPNEENNF